MNRDIKSLVQNIDYFPARFDPRSNPSFGSMVKSKLSTFPGPISFANLYTKLILSFLIEAFIVIEDVHPKLSSCLLYHITTIVVNPNIGVLLLEIEEEVISDDILVFQTYLKSIDLNVKYP